jgi:hypothetical protein
MKTIYAGLTADAISASRPTARALLNGSFEENFGSNDTPWHRHPNRLDGGAPSSRFVLVDPSGQPRGRIGKGRRRVGGHRRFSSWRCASW